VRQDFNFAEFLSLFLEKQEEEKKRMAAYMPHRILKSGDRTIVFWQDGEKTVVKRSQDEPESDYAAFTAALGIKVYGSNSALKRIVERTETQRPKKQKKTVEETVDESAARWDEWFDYIEKCMRKQNGSST